MVDKNENISSSQLMLFIISAQTGKGIINVLSLLSKDSGHDGWISILITGLIVICFSFTIDKLLKKYENKSILEINKYIFGKYIGFLLNNLIFLYLLLFGASIIRIFTLFIRLTLLSKTNIYILSLFILFPFIYITWYGLKPICRFNSIILVILILIIIYIILIGNELKLSFLLPLGESGFNSILKGIRPSFFNYLGVELITVIYPHITNKEKSLKYFIIANSISMGFITIVVASTTALLGENFLKNLAIPLFSMARVYKAPILERVDLYFIGIWFIAFGCSFMCYLYSGYTFMNKLYFLKKKKKSLIFYSIFIFIISRIPKNSNQVFNLINIIDYFGIGVFVFLILCYFLSFIFKRGVINNDK